MSKSQVAKNLVSKKAVAVKKLAVKADSKPIKKAKSAVPLPSSQGSSQENKKKTSKATS